MFRAIGTSIFQNLGDAIATIVMWIVWYAIYIIKNLTSDFIKEIPLLGRFISSGITHILSWVYAPCLELAIALTLGLGANLAWDIYSAFQHWSADDPSKVPLVPAPGALNWVVTGVFFLLFTILAALGHSVVEFLYWASWWQVALAILVIIGVIVASFLLRGRLFGGHRQRRRRR